jgi:ammonia channel protein AmtB
MFFVAEKLMIMSVLIAVHLVYGVLGTLFVGLFAQVAVAGI